MRYRVELHVLTGQVAFYRRCNTHGGSPLGLSRRDRTEGRYSRSRRGSAIASPGPGPFWGFCAASAAGARRNAEILRAELDSSRRSSSTALALKVLPILPGRHLECALKDTAHAVHAAKPAFRGNSLEAMRTLLQAPACCLEPQALYEPCRRDIHISGEDPGKVARAHCNAFGERLHTERSVQVIEHP